MKKLRALLAFLLVVLLAMPSSGLAQERHAVELATLARTLERHAADQEAKRASIREAIGRPEVREMAGRLGVDLDRFNDSLLTLGTADLDRAAEAAGQVNEALAGGASSITLSVTTIIIILLVVILLIVALK